MGLLSDDGRKAAGAALPDATQRQRHEHADKVWSWRIKSGNTKQPNLRKQEICMDRDKNRQFSDVQWKSIENSW
jgi:hypothetical protein